MSTVHAIRSSRIVTPSGVRPGVVVILDGRILAIAPFTETFDGWSVMDVGDYMLLPGLVDVHSQLHEPGRSDWDGFAVGTKTAAAGGFTTIIDMPFQYVPQTTNVGALTEKRVAVSGRAWVDYAFWAGVDPQNPGGVSALAKAGVRGFKCFPVRPELNAFSTVERDGLARMVQAVAQTGLPLLAHTEWSKQVTDLTSPLSESCGESSEAAAIHALVDLIREYQCKLHIVHFSAGHLMSILQAARAEGLAITVETCPHCLYFSVEDIPDVAVHFECSPPIREAVNQALLWEALRSGGIDLIATDHSPSPSPAENGNAGGYRNAWGSIISLSVSLPAMWTAARERGFHITDLVRWTAETPATLAGLSSTKGRIAPGCDADMVVFDPDASFEVAADLLPTRNNLSPYVGETLEGRVLSTILRGELLYDEGRFPYGPTGRECIVQGK